MADKIMIMIMVLVALIMATAITNANAATGFLPWRYNRFSFTVSTFNECNLSALRCGHSEDVDDAVGYAEEATVVSRNISEQPSKNFGSEIEHVPLNATDISTTETKHTECAKKDVEGRNHDLIVGNRSTVASESSAYSEKKSDGTNTMKHPNGAWEEEIRRTQAYYNSPQVSSSSAGKILSPEGAPENDDNQAEVPTNDERVAGDDPAASHNITQKNGVVEKDVEKYSAGVSVASAKVVDEPVRDDIDERRSQQSHLGPITGVAPHETDDVSEIYTEEKEVDVREPVDTSSQNDESNIAPDNETNDHKLPPAEENTIDHEESCNDVDAGIKGGISDEDEALPIKEEEDSDKEDLMFERISNVNTARDESGQEQSVAADVNESHLESLITDTHRRDISPISNDVGLKEEDPLDIPRWQKATTETASNKLVEEGLRRLLRRDGDEPSIPYVITRAMKKVLIDELGYDPLEVKSMRPDVAVVIVAENLERPDVEILPPRFYNDIVKPVIAIEEIREEKPAKGAVVSFFRRLRKDASIALAGRDPKSTIITVASLGVALTLLIRPSRDKRPWESNVLISESQPSIEVLSDTVERELSAMDEDLNEHLAESDDVAFAKSEQKPNDLDKSWIDKLISLVSKPFGA